MAAELRYCGEDDLAPVQDFFARYWGENHIIARDLAFARWQMSPARTDAFGDAALAALSYWDKERLVGFIGVMPMSFNFSGRVIPSAWMCNLQAAPEYLEQGIGMKLMLAVHNLPFDAVGAVGINPRVVPMFRAMRYNCSDRIPRYVRVVNTGAFERLTGRNRPPIRPSAPPAQTGISVSQAITVPVEWDPFWHQFVSRGYFGTHRDSEFMRWRYLDHPWLRYRFAIARTQDSEVAGAVVWRVESVRDSDIAVVRLIELITTDFETTRALASFVEQEARAAGAAMLDHYGMHANKAALEACGWFDESDFPDLVVPSLFQPLVAQRRSMNFAVRTLPRSGIRADEYAHVLSVIKSDGDQDRPN
ncbi:MAG: GNAT family N-acetyltransferase [Rhizobiaceae bacterium]|nr:GNAT family N-acetyltransferase [Rhizobiaceae bacterium]